MPNIHVYEQCFFLFISNLTIACKLLHTGQARKEVLAHTYSMTHLSFASWKAFANGLYLIFNAVICNKRENNNLSFKEQFPDTYEEVLATK